MKISRLLIAAPAAALGAYAATRGLRRVVRDAVADAFDAERVRELDEARAFWREQEAREEEVRFPVGPLLPQQAGPLEDLVGEEAELDPEFARSLRAVLETMAEPGSAPAAPAAPGARPDPLRHPANAEWAPAPAAEEDNRAFTEQRLRELCDSGSVLADVRPGPMGTLDLFVFADGTTLCVIPGSPEATAVLAGSLNAGRAVRLLGGSSVSGSYALTFTVESGDEWSAGPDTVYLVADRVVASL